MVKKHFGTKNLIKREESVLIIIDIQDKLTPRISNNEKVIANIIRLLKFSRIIGLPVLLLEQEKLGQTLPEIKKEIPDSTPITKNTFNCFLSNEFRKRIRQLRPKTLILAGVETHICVAQTALSAIPKFNVQVVSDAVSSRSFLNWIIGIERMRQAGVTITSTEMLIFELLERAGTDEFRAAIKLMK
jgi:nicotinamidase-related amidase